MGQTSFVVVLSSHGLNSVSLASRERARQVLVRQVP